MSTETVFWTPEELAERYSLDVRTIYRMLKSGLIRGKRYGPKKGYRVTDADRQAYEVSRPDVAERPKPVYVSVPASLGLDAARRHGCLK